MAGVSAFFNGPTPQLFKALSESDEEGEALYNLSQSRQMASSGMPDLEGLEPGDLVG